MGYIVHKSMSMAGRKYPDGESVPDSLPERGVSYNKLFLKEK